MPGGKDLKEQASDFEKISYPDFRRILLSEWQDAEEEVVWLVQAGAYLRACWLKEENFRGEATLDEDATKPLWDDFTRSALTEIQVKSQTALRQYTARRRFAGISDDIASALKRTGIDAAASGVVVAVNAVAAFLKLIIDVFKQMWHGVLHLAGILLVGAILARYTPDFMRHVQDAVASFVHVGK